jgi:hypothetical protein
MENNDPYEELEIYLKQINVSTHTRLLLDCPSKEPSKKLLRGERRNFSFFVFFLIAFMPIDRLFCPFRPKQNKHIMQARKKKRSPRCRCYRMNSIPFMMRTSLASKAISFYIMAFLSFLSYFNHDRLIAVCVLPFLCLCLGFVRLWAALPWRHRSQAQRAGKEMNL